MALKSVSRSQHQVPARVIARIWESVDLRTSDECWPWLKSLGSHGYGQIGWGRPGGGNAGTTAHRVAWLAAGREIPPDMTLDHACRNRPCCNPAHLRLRTNVANATDNGQGKKTHCPRGHPYSGDNLYVRPSGHRLCRTCAREYPRKKVA